MAEISYLNKDYNTAIKEFERIEKIYKGTKSAGISLFYLANSYYNSGKYEEAEKAFRKYLENYDNNPMLHSSSLSGIAATYEERKMYDKAFEFYKKAADDYPELFTVPENLIDAARCLKKLGRKSEAEAILQKLIEKFPDSGYKQRAEALLYQL